MKGLGAVLVLAIAMVGCGGGSMATSANGQQPGSPETAGMSNNTSAATDFAGSSNGNSPATNVSKVSMHTLLYPGASTKIYAQLQGWFGAANHMNVGYKSDDPNQVKRQVEDAMSRGIDGFILDWYGPTGDAISQNTALMLKTVSENHPNFTFAIQEDQGALATCNCDATQRLISDLSYAYSQFEQSPAYMKRNGRPLVFLFDISGFPVDWARVRAQVPGNPLFIDRYRGGYDPFQTWFNDGGFAWPLVSGSPNDWDSSDLNAFYGAALSDPSKYALGTSYKGFNDGAAVWSLHRSISQQCGQVWLDTWNTVSSRFNGNDQLDAIQIATWNDYEEGTEIETGIDNCLDVQASLSGDTVSFSPTGKGTEDTVDHYTILATQDKRNFTNVADVPVGTRSVELGQYKLSPGTYSVYVQMTGKPGFTNKTSQPLTYTR